MAPLRTARAQSAFCASRCLSNAELLGVISLPWPAQGTELAQRVLCVAVVLCKTMSRTETFCIQEYGSEQLTGLEGSVWFCTPRLCESFQMIFHSSWQVDGTYVWLARKDLLPLQVFPVPISVSAGRSNSARLTGS